MIWMTDDQRLCFRTFLESLTALELVQVQRDARMQDDDLTLQAVCDVMQGRVVNAEWKRTKQHELEKADT